MKKEKLVNGKKKNVEKVHSAAVCGSVVEPDYAKRGEFLRLCECHNALARYIGLPCVVKPDKMTPYPATLGEYGVRSKDFVGYRVNLEPYAGNFKRVRFRGACNFKNVICGCIINKEGYVERFASVPDADGWVTLDIEPSSFVLHASVPAEKGRCLWSNLEVEFYSDGVRAKLFDVFNELDARLARVELSLRHLTGVRKSASGACL